MNLVPENRHGSRVKQGRMERPSKISKYGAAKESPRRIGVMPLKIHGAFGFRFQEEKHW
jgi:hypothetical protein